ncbi:hypothetical protein QW131_27050 [Roseibium salinum]|nr:hypothetical protein [Roseibium salinum]
MDDEQLDRVFKALADPTRRRIIDRLRERPDQSLFQICVLSASEDGKALSRQAITQHLYMLEKKPGWFMCPGPAGRNSIRSTSLRCTKQWTSGLAITFRKENDHENLRHQRFRGRSAKRPWISIRIPSASR